ncbi:MAG TPA: helix-turn-helix transcriptional regulator [Vicinamibacterales bacterium]|nr:helix-turn-helix transcriptional regulator [Vicinamibacterales bacterium]
MVHTGSITVAANIRRIRHDRRWSQSDLARVVGVHQNLISRIEIGARPCTPVEMLAFAQALDVDLKHLLATPKPLSPFRASHGY